MKYLPLLILIFACSKKTDPTTTTQADPQNLSSKIVGSWKLTAASSDKPYDWNGDGVTETDIYAVSSTCEKNLVMQFAGNGTGSMIRTCMAAWPTKWNIANNSTELHYSFATNGSSYGADVNNKIITLNTTTLSFSYVTQPPNGQFYTVTNSFVKQ